MSKRTGTIIQIICFAVFLICALWLGKYFYDTRAANENLSEIQQIAEKVSKTEERGENGMIAAYGELYAKNSDIAGWIKIDGTKINYPVMQTEDNEFYLKKGFEKEYQSGGLPFADYQCNVSKPSDNVVIYGHNMKNGSMFAALLQYTDKEFFDAHKIIEFDTLYERGKYEILCVFRTGVGGKNEIRYHEFIDAGSQEEFDEFIEKVKAQSIIWQNDVNYGDKLLTLSTCSYNMSNERFAVIAKKIK